MAEHDGLLGHIIGHTLVIATLLAASLLTASCGTIDPTAFTRH